MQKPVEPRLGHRQDLPGRLQDPDVMTGRQGRERALDVVRREAVAVAGPAKPLVGQRDGGEVGQEGIHRDQPFRGAQPSRLQPVERRGVLDTEPPRPRPPQPLEVSAAAEHLPEVVRQGPHVEAGG